MTPPDFTPPVNGEGRLSLADAFEMGCAWTHGLQGQTLEDSRAVGRTLGQDIFDPIGDAITREIKRQGFNSFEDADAGICAAKRIILAALSTPNPHPGEGVLNRARGR